jgi:hypothetical protein
MINVMRRERFIPHSQGPFDATAPVVGEGFSFNMTAGDDEGGNTGFAGAGNAFAIPPIGSIDAEPITGEVMDVCVENDSAFVIAFVGDLTATLAGLTVWVDGIEYPPDSDWSFSGVTFYSSNSPPEFLDTNSYFIEIK